MSLTRRTALRLAGVGLGALALPRAWASFERSDWPRQTPTPALDALDLTGRRLTLADYQGRVLVLNFWASWCEPCRAEMPTLQQLPAVLGEERVAVLGLNFKEGPRRIAQFAQAAGVTLPLALDPQGDIARAWGVKVFPTTILIDTSGRARTRVRGEVDWSSPQALGWIEALLRR
ncbi:MAG: TlpA disulfide reductase family protein [Hydrogenophaga sp.]|nr:TlpA disulfide reductase family protein [Hydrogenophaga sp.]